MTKKFKYKKVKNLNVSEMDALGAEGWELVGVEGGDGVFKRDETRLEYIFYPVPVMRRGEGALVLDEAVNAMAADGWRLASVLQGPRAMDATLLFEREAG